MHLCQQGSSRSEAKRPRWRAPGAQFSASTRGTRITIKALVSMTFGCRTTSCSTRLSWAGRRRRSSVAKGNMLKPHLGASPPPAALTAASFVEPCTALEGPSVRTLFGDPRMPLSRATPVTHVLRSFSSEVVETASDSSAAARVTKKDCVTACRCARLVTCRAVSQSVSQSGGAVTIARESKPG